jgi:hypothetical protein
MNDRFRPLLEEIDFVLAERREHAAIGISVKLVHRFRIPGTDCGNGEEVFAIVLFYRGTEYQLRLSPALLLLGDYLLRHGRYAQTASQISTGIHAGRFYAEHGKNGRRQRIRRIPRSAIREYIKRLEFALALALGEANLCIDPKDVLLTEESVSNHVLYRWRAIVEVVHLNSTAASAQPIFEGVRKWQLSVPDFDAR